MIVLAVVAIGALVPVVMWSAWLEKRAPHRRRAIRAICFGAIAGAVILLIVAGVSFAAAFAAVSNANSSMKATLLAEGISRAMNCAALAVVVVAAAALALGAIQLASRRRQ